MIGFLIDNWLWIGLIVWFVAMHRRGRGCGMHGRHSGHSEAAQAKSSGDGPS